VPNSTPEIPSNYRWIAFTAHAWGSGDSRKEALKALRDHAGDRVMKQHGYTLYRCPPGCEISTIDGSISYPKDAPVKPTMVEDGRPMVTMICPRCNQTSKHRRGDKLKCGNCLATDVEVVGLVEKKK